MKMMLSILSVIFTAKIAFAIDYMSLEEAVEKKNLDRVKSIIGTEKHPFEAQSGISKLLNDRQTVYNQPDKFGVFILGKSVGVSNKFGTYQCDPEIVKILLDHEAKPTRSHLVAASINSCPEIIDAITVKLSDEEVAQSGDEFLEFAIKNISPMSSDDQNKQNDYLQRFLKIIEFYGNKIKASCTLEKQSSPWCKTKESMKSFVSAVRETQRTEEYQASPEGLKDRMCDIQEKIQKQEDVIANQNEIGKVSGVVNQEILYKAGNEVVRLKKNLDAVKKEYKKATKKDFDHRLCIK